MKRDGDKCCVHARVTPETRVTSKAYAVQVTIDEAEEQIESADCQDCVAAPGGCKHVAALLGWLNTMSSTVSVTSTQCYWKKARLSCVPAELKSAKAAALRPKQRKANASQGNHTSGRSFLQDVLQTGSSRNCTGLLFAHFGERNSRRSVRELGIDQLLQLCRVSDDAETLFASSFIAFCTARMSPALCSLVESETRGQSVSSLWHALRFGRVTASNAYSAAHCQATKCTLVSIIVGASRVRDNAAMLRGRTLEPQVLMQVKAELGADVRPSGLVLSPEYPVLGASPDGLMPDGSVVEVKCPASEKAFKKYILTTGDVAARYRAQLQVLMTLTRADRAFFLCCAP